MRKKAAVAFGCFWMLAALALGAPRPCAAENTLTDAEKAAGWKLLFDGTSLANWAPLANKESWVAEDGVLVFTQKGGGYLRTAEQYGNFVLSLDFKLPPGANSGVFVRWADPNDPVQTGIEVQLLDSFGQQKPSRYDCGAVYDCLAPAKAPYRPAGEWSTMAITCKDNRVAVALNGVDLLEMDLDQWTEPHKNPDGTPNKFNTAYKEMPRSGYIGLQDHGSRLWFRNIKIRSL